MKKLLISLVVLTTIFSCGKKNTVSSSSVSGLNSSITGSVEVELASKINNNSFGTGTVYVNGYPESFSQLVSQYPAVKYKYGTYKMVTNTSSSNTKCVLLVICATWSGFNTSTPVSFTSTREVYHSSINDADKKSQLINLINSRVAVQRDTYNTNVYYVVTSDSKVYTIDTGLPLQGNPAAIQNTDGTREIFYQWSVF